MVADTNADTELHQLSVEVDKLETIAQQMFDSARAVTDTKYYQAAKKLQSVGVALAHHVGAMYTRSLPSLSKQLEQPTEDLQSKIDTLAEIVDGINTTAQVIDGVTQIAAIAAGVLKL